MRIPFLAIAPIHPSPRHNVLVAAALSLLLLAQAAPGASPSSDDPGWPRERVQNGARLVIYQPQVDEWKNFEELSWRMAVAVTPKGGKEVVGALEMKGKTSVNNEDKVVTITNMEVTAAHFPPGNEEQLQPLVKTFLPPTFNISLYRLIASATKPEAEKSVQANNDPPEIFVAYRPSILLNVDGDPSLAEIADTTLKYVVNTPWPLFFDGENYYLLAAQQWLSSKTLEGKWAPTTQLPPDISKLPQKKEWSDLKKVIPPSRQTGSVIPDVFYSNKPSEIILFNGQPAYSAIPETHLVYATNTSSAVFQDTTTKNVYYLTAGRWFTANDLKGPWTFATDSLPEDFAKIPTNSPVADVLASVPGTDESKDAVLLAQVPTTMMVNPAAAEAEVKVEYAGEPHFEPITGTAMKYATNTQDKVIQLGESYYLCLNGIWFTSTTPQGSWKTATSIPPEIYTIPPNSPLYNVTYVTQTSTPDGSVQSSYTAGYLGAFIAGAVVISGTGYWAPPYIYAGYYYPRPIPYGYSYYATPHYWPATGAYGWSQSVYGPYGSAAPGAYYNPYTGTYARGATASTPYGSRTVAQAYNPYTGRYAATSQGSNPNAQWGHSTFSNGSQTAYTQHYSTANGTEASVQGSNGGKAAGVNTAWGNSAAGKTANGNMYAEHDGNVYKNTGSGWEKYDNGSWNPVEKPVQNSSQNSSKQTDENRSNTSMQQRSSASNTETNRPSSSQESNKANDRSSSRGEQRNTNSSGRSSQMQNLDQEARGRQRGSQQSNRFQQSQRSGHRGRR